MEDLQNINSIINQSIKDSSYITAIISSSVFLIYTFIIRMIDYIKSKHKEKPIYEMSKAMKEIGDNIVKLNEILNKTLQDAERKEIRQCETTIQLGFKAFGFKIIQESFTIIIHNNIDKNKELIKSNIYKIVNNEYYKLYSALSVYEINNIHVCTKLKEEWIQEVSDAIITIMFDGQEYINRVAHINDKITILINEYSTYVINKTINV